jgi:hypothetical protein
MPRFFKLALIQLIICFAFVGCNSKGCYENMNVRFVAGFYFVQRGSATRVSMDSVTVKGVGMDSMIYDNKTLSGMTLYLNPTATSTQFQISVQDNGQIYTDTLTIHHNNHPSFESLECGYKVYYTLTSCSGLTTLADSVSIYNASVNNETKEHVKIYF